MGKSEKIIVAVSSCLLGQTVRYDAGHKRDDFIVDTLGNYFEWLPVCPEVELGLGVPREPLHLEKKGNQVRLVTTSTGEDHSEAMRAYAQKRIRALKKLGISGYILKKSSPSCGMERVKVFGPKKIPVYNGRGLFAERLLSEMSTLPVEEEGRLHDPVLRENWVERVFAFHALQKLWRSPWKLNDLVQFHTRHKLALLAHSEIHYRRMGKLVAAAKGMPRDKLAEAYEREFMAALRLPATPRRNTNVLLHMAGYFKKKMDAAAKRELLSTIEDYRRGLVPLSVPLTLVSHYVRVFDEAYLKEQTFLNPHPKELALRHFILAG